MQRPKTRPLLPSRDKDDKKWGQIAQMSVVPFAASQDSDPAAPQPADAPDARQRMLAVRQKLAEASSEIESLQAVLASQHELEQLLKQGRAHLQELRNRLQQTAAERDRLQADAAEAAAAHQREIGQIDQQMDALRAELQGAIAERNHLAAQIAQQESAHRQFADERDAEQGNFTRLLDEASSIQRELTEEVQEQRQQIHKLREAAMRAQAFAHDIIRAHEASPPLSGRNE
jgi:chromosome segregation ATPase